MSCRLFVPLLALLMWCCALSAFAQTAAQTPPTNGGEGTALQRDEDGVPQWQFAPVIVSGAVPGPGIWQVRKGGHVLHIVGTLSPLPSRLQWESAELRTLMAASQQYLPAPSMSIGSDIGRLRALTMLPSMLSARRIPDGKSLKDVVSAEDYRRWEVLKARYIGSDSSIERWRPIFASGELYAKAIRRSGLNSRNVVATTAATQAKELGVEVVDTRWEVKVENPRQLLREFAETRLDDGACFSRTLRRVEADLGHMVERANAWAIGDLDMLRQLPVNSQAQACMDAISQTAIAERIGISDMQAQVFRHWLQIAEGALARNTSTVAVFPVDGLLSRDGVLAQLRAKGYEVIEPVAR